MGDRALLARRGAEIHAYVGENGGFKSYCAVRDTIPSLWMDRPVASTLLILDPDRDAQSMAQYEDAWLGTGLDEYPPPDKWASGTLRLPHPLWRPVVNWSDLMGLRRTDLLLDEVQGIVNSRAHQSLPPAVMNQIHQMRRADCVIRWTTPAYARADVALREVTKAVTYCKGLWPERQKGVCALRCDLHRRDPDHEHVWPSLWGRNRMALWRTYNALDFDEFTSADVNRQAQQKGAAQPDKLRTLAREFHLRRKTSEVIRYYDSMQDVLTIRDVTEAGTCLSCGGNRRRPSCSCDKDSAERGRTPQAPARSPRGLDADHAGAVA